MSNNVEQGLPSIDFLTDFIYIDQIKTRNFLAQFVNKGVLSAFKEEFIESDASASKLGVNKVFIAEKSGQQQDTQKYAREYDTSHSLPLTLLDLLSEHSFIKQSISDAAIGNLLLISGEYRIFDTSLLEKVIPVAGMVAGKSKKNISQEQQAINKALALFPKNLQIDLIDDNDVKYWVPLKRENLLINIDDLLLANGTYNADKWFILGILENMPSNHLENNRFNDAKAVLSEMYNPMREIVGRDTESYSITPILIFRKITR
ncbi:hypothetical protein [Avibacterium paragallinarum]|uniref:DUF6414 family protein n=1 Tax=Avibacterium paragallinarum TaxID=728 RepID=UPI00397C8994